VENEAEGTILGRLAVDSGVASLNEADFKGTPAQALFRSRHAPWFRG
jgi:hypothetical protein